MLGMPRGGPPPGVRGAEPSGRAPAAHGPCVHRCRRLAALRLHGCAMDGDAAGAADDGTVVYVCTLTLLQGSPATPAQAPEGWLPTMEGGRPSLICVPRVSVHTRCRARSYRAQMTHAMHAENPQGCKSILSMSPICTETVAGHRCTQTAGCSRHSAAMVPDRWR